MTFHKLDLSGAFVIVPELIEDERGSFARTWCRREFDARGLDSRLVQCSTSINLKKGTLRGMHYQAAPHAEVKLVRCARGAIYDVIVDLRPESPTFNRWAAVKLTEDDHRTLYIPEGFAHGFQTLADRTEVVYQMSAYFEPSSSRGVRWDDPAFGIVWPAVESRIISAKDQAFPNHRSSTAPYGQTP